MEVVGYQLVNMSTNEVIQSWGGVSGEMPAVPNPIFIPGIGFVYGPLVNVDYNGYMLKPWEVDNPQPRVPQSISRRQCALQLLAIGMISGPEAVEMTRNGTPPASVQNYIDALPDESHRYIALINFAAMEYHRSNPLLNELMAANGGTPESIDAFFVAAAAL